MKVRLLPLLRKNTHMFVRTAMIPIRAIRGSFILLIVFYQNHLSRHTCLYSPSCSEYAKRCINNYGVILGILLGIWRILRCNPLSKGGIDPAPEPFWKKRWLI